MNIEMENNKKKNNNERKWWEKKKKNLWNDGIDAVTIIFYRVFPWVDFLMDFHFHIFFLLCVTFKTENAGCCEGKSQNKE